jgi:cell volume regulation protein A
MTHFTEPHDTAVGLFAVGLLLTLAALLSRVTRRTGLPLPLLFLGIGMLAGSEGIGGIAFDNYRLSLRLGTLALALILFDGGLNTPLATLRRGLAPAGLLATAGVLMTAALVAVFARLLGLEWAHAALLGAVVSSTDAAAVFSALRAGGVQLKKRVGITLELESGLNDPMAVLLTTTLVGFLSGGSGPSAARLILEVPLQLAVGGILGVGIGHGARLAFRKARLSAAGLYPVLSVAIALLAFSAPTILWGSGFLAVYLAGMVLGNGDIPYKSGLLRVHDAAAWFSQVGMFLVLGLLVFPFNLVKVAGLGVAVALFLTAVARPLAAALCLTPFRYSPREIGFVGWAGLRGAVPIILAIFPVLARVPGAERIFDVVFFVVVVNALIPGATIGWMTRRLGLEDRTPPQPPALLEVNAVQSMRGEVLSFHIAAASAVCGSAIADLPFPAGAAVMLVVRGHDLLAPRGGTVLLPDDHVYIICSPQDRPMIHLLFGREEHEGD